PEEHGEDAEESENPRSRVHRNDQEEEDVPLPRRDARRDQGDSRHEEDEAEDPEPSHRTVYSRQGGLIFPPVERVEGLHPEFPPLSSSRTVMYTAPSEGSGFPAASIAL